MQVTIVDYGMGNIWSVMSALRHLHAEPVLVSAPERIAKADCLVLPGVGSFRKAMETLRAEGCDKAIVSAVRERHAKILGICLGMQLLGLRGTEDGETSGLGLVPNCVERFTDDELCGLRLPHVGFNEIRPSALEGMFAGLPQFPDFYFVHSYRMLPEALNARIATCLYGVPFLAAFEFGNVWGTQFHPEKSQTNGLRLLRNFLAGTE